MKKIFLITAAAILFFASSLSIFRAEALSAPLHLDKTNVKRGCAGCHTPHKGKSSSTLLEKERENLCGKCHDAVIEDATKKNDIGDGKNPKDVYTSLRKASNHPVLTTTKHHNLGETLPETDIQKPRHVACFDCHNTHLSTTDDKFKGLQGVTTVGSKKIKGVTNESELCYRCHGDSANLPGDQKNKRLEFLPANASYHPVEGAGRRAIVPSLRRPLTTSSIITCSGCHGNDEPQGAKGPHGSNFAPILKYNYSSDDNQPESYYRYESCYKCHDRNSILADESFKTTDALGAIKGHNYHIATARASCYACHNSHGSQKYKDLIDFDETIVVPNQNGRLDYVHEGSTITCYLKCHNKQHGL